MHQHQEIPTPSRSLTPSTSTYWAEWAWLLEPGQIATTLPVYTTDREDHRVAGRLAPGGADPLDFAGPIVEPWFVPSSLLIWDFTRGSDLTTFANASDSQVSSRVGAGWALHAHS